MFLNARDVRDVFVCFWMLGMGMFLDVLRFTPWIDRKTSEHNRFCSLDFLFCRDIFPSKLNPEKSVKIPFSTFSEKKQHPSLTRAEVKIDWKNLTKNETQRASRRLSYLARFSCFLLVWKYPLWRTGVCVVSCNKRLVQSPNINNWARDTTAQHYLCIATHTDTVTHRYSHTHTHSHTHILTHTHRYSHTETVTHR